MRRILNFLIAIDQLLYVLVTLGSGSPDETLSSAAWRTEQKGRWFGCRFRPVIDGLFYVLTLGREVDHCRRSYLAERYRRQLPNDF